MRTVWKYNIDVGSNDILIPKDAEILCAQIQGEHIAIWVLADPEMEKETRRVFITATGHPIEALNVEYIGTVHVGEGEYILHVFEEVI